MTHKCVSHLGHHGFRWWLVAYSTPIYHLLAYYQLEHWKHISVKCESKHNNFYSMKCIWNVICKMVAISSRPHCVDILRPRQNVRHFPDDIFKCIFVNDNVWISIKISLKFAPKARINNILALVQIMAWRRPGGKPLSETIVVSFLAHICVTQPHWVKSNPGL